MLKRQAAGIIVVVATFYCSYALCQQRRANVGCGIPPSLWCSDENIAKSCGVYEQCKPHLYQMQSAPPVNFTVYYESLCPDSARFFNTELVPAYSEVASITNLALVPYGNAEEKKEGNVWKFTCQHGPNECLGNVIDTCAINIIKDISIYFPFIACNMKMRTTLVPPEAAKKCGEILHVDTEPIFTCANSTKGNELEHQMAVRTDALDPPKTYVPWVTLNGVHTEAIEDRACSDLLQLICETYTGTKPKACTEKKLGQCFQ